MSLIAHYPANHAGELSQILSVRRGEAWEEGEENNINTRGHHVKPPWLEDISHIE